MLSQETTARVILSILALCWTLHLEAGDTAGQALGSADFQPSPAHPIGWRGDGTGCYPQANPPLHWSRISKNMAGVTTQVKKPGGEPSGQPLANDGVIREWLVLGPAPVAKGAKVADELLPGEAQFAPEENQKVGDLVWKLAKTDSSYLDFSAILGKNNSAAAFAHAYVYSSTGLPLIIREARPGQIKCWLNGKEVYVAGGLKNDQNAWSSQVELKVNKGWNSLLLKVYANIEGWHTTFTLYGGAPWEYENKNIIWTCRTPNIVEVYESGCRRSTGNGAPIIVGDKIFLTSDPYDLCCINKADGKILWVRTNSYFETLSEEEKKNLPEIAALADKLKQINDLFGTATSPTDKQIQEKHQLEGQIIEAMKKVDKQKYTMVHGQDVGYAGMTPVSDGKQVWAWFATGVSVCYDLAGKRQWIHLANHTTPEHGFASSPVLAGDKFAVNMTETIALNAKTGEVAWRSPGGFFGTSQTAYLKGEALLVTPPGDILRVSDGKTLYKRGAGSGIAASPVVKGDMIYRLLWGSGWEALKLPATPDEPFKVEVAKTGKIDTSNFPKYWSEWYTSSPLFYNGLFYCTNNDGTLSVVDTTTGNILYQKMLDINICYNTNMGAARGVGSSITLAGKYICIFGNQGAAVFLEPGPVFKQVAKNCLENVIDIKEWWWHQESTVASPVFEGNRLYYRAEGNLYCIGAP